MSWFGRWWSRPEPVQAPQPPTEIVGGWVFGSTGFPYEFDPGTGSRVPVHEMDFVGVEYVVDPPRLTIRFSNGTARTETEPAGPPFAVFKFSDVQIWQWEDDHDLFDVPEDARGQVELFDWHAPTNTFDLQTINTRLLFSARRLVVRVDPPVHWVAQDTEAASTVVDRSDEPRASRAE